MPLCQRPLFSYEIPAIFPDCRDKVHIPQLPENEDLTMHLAEAAKIRVVPHSLIRLADERLGYITQRIDRTKTGEKIDMDESERIILSVMNKELRAIVWLGALLGAIIGTVNSLF